MSRIHKKPKQLRSERQPQDEAKIGEDRCCMFKQQIWVPYEVDDLRLQIAVEANCAERKHGARGASLEMIESLMSGLA